MVDIFSCVAENHRNHNQNLRGFMEIITRMTAAKAGMKRYYTGKQCKHGHDSERWVYNGHCVECTLESNRRRHAEIKRIMKEASEGCSPEVI